MNNASLNYLKKSGGWEVGTAPSLVVVDSAVAGSLSTTTPNKGIYVFFFKQKGLMGGLGLQGTKITEYTPSKYVPHSLVDRQLRFFPGAGS